MNKILTKLKKDYAFYEKHGQSILIIGMIMVVVLPFVIASSMTFLCGDDFAQLPIQEFNGNIIDLLLIALKYVKHMYLKWQGAYFSMFISILFHPILGGGVFFSCVLL